jgi:D-alanyl-D-alanine carboxypeptidase (penicillin-binding protein 5/6)
MNVRYLFLAVVLATTQSLAADARPLPAPPIIGAASYLVIDGKTGETLASLQPDNPVAPASLTKLMTAYVAFRALREEQIRLEDEVTVSEKAWRTPGSRMFIEVGKRVSIENLMLGMIVQSGNDASVALAEHIAGSESVFAEMMNQHARELGMLSSNFMNVTGLPHADHYSTARDLATLAQAIIVEFPDYYRWYSVRDFTFNDIKQPNRNNLLWRDESVDGMKTGFTDAAGYCLVGFFETRLVYEARAEIARPRIWKSANEYSPLGLLEDLYVTIPRGSYDSLESVLNMPAILLAPVAEGQPLAEITISLNGEPVATESLRALNDNPDGSFWQRTRDSVSLMLE